MAIWHEPYPGFFADQLRIEPTVDEGWFVDNDNANQFAELNQAILEFIHFEKRFPKKEEYHEIYDRTMLPELYSWDKLNELFPEDSGTIVAPHIKEKEFESLYYQNPISDNGMSWEDFVKHENKPQTALASTNGINKHTLNHRLI